MATNAQYTLVTSGNTCTPNEQQLNENTNPVSMTPTITVTESTRMDTTKPQDDTSEDLQRESCIPEV